jgi:predicted enzyme related to lactoylglutathione lyase
MAMKKSPAVKVRSASATSKAATRAKTGKAGKRAAAGKPAGRGKPGRTAATPARAAGKATKAAAKPAAAKAKAPRPRTSAKAGGGAMLQKVAFTMFPVADSTRARAFYEEVLGLTRGLSAPNGMWTEYDLPGGGCLALFCHPQFAGKPGGASIAFEVADLDALNERLRPLGVVYQGDLVHGPNCRMSNILDSEGNQIILHELNDKP